MPETTTRFDAKEALVSAEQAVVDGKLSSGAITNIKQWLTESRYSEYAGQVAEQIANEQWQDLDDAFWTVIPFGTGGRRGRMNPIGSNAINDRTIGESAQGLADYVKEHTDSAELSCAIAFDTRHNSKHFARLCSEIMVAAGFKVYLLDEIRSTPELSFLVRYKKCCCGIMVTASHNPPSDNAVKVYWSTGGQILPPHDKGVIDRVMTVDAITRSDFDQAISDGKVIPCNAEVDAAFFGELKSQAFAGPRDLKIIYSPLHGVGSTAAVPALNNDGFTDVEVFADHAEPDGDFPNVPNHVANPENVAVFDRIIERAQQVGADLILASDPDCDRLGVAAPVTTDSSGAWQTFNGNQIGVLLTDYILEQSKKAGNLSSEHFVVKTLVTTEMIRRIADSYGVKTFGELLVGFKWIGGVIDEEGADKFLFGTEESHGYLVGQYARDKDGAVAAMLMAELAANCKASGQSLHEKLEALFWQHGYHAERLMTQQMPGSEGMARMQSLMNKFRTDPPKSIGGLAVSAVRDYKNNTQAELGSPPEALQGPTGDLIILDLAETGNYIAARPSGTEPKVKFYMFTYVAPEQLASLEMSQQEMSDRLDAFQSDLTAFAESIE
ncbi:MAG: phospho-sugar mutase [Planctomycetaceae bacterium]|nr:phospho-sugar mutase [Planctomycetaceae bacterium]